MNIKNKDSEPAEVTLLTAREVMEKCAIRRTSLWTKTKDGIFPKPVTIGGRSLRWRSDEVNEWILTRERAAYSTRGQVA